jgi:hypothetical protein
MADVRTVGPVFMATVPAALDVDVMVVVRARKMRGANHNLSVPVPVTCFGRPFTHHGQYTYPRVRGTRSLGPAEPPLNLPKPKRCPPWLFPSRRPSRRQNGS